MQHQDLIARARLQAERLRERDAAEQARSVARVADLRSELIDRYEFLGEIHRGGQGVVYRAVQRGAERPVAIKVLHGGVLGLHTTNLSDATRLRFEREIRILAGLRHPHIVAIHDSGTAGGAFYYVMDLVDGRPLDRYIRDEALSVPATLTLFIQVAEAVHAAHLRGVIHRDLKPGNILVTADAAPVVLDFGLAKLTEDEDNSSAAAAMTRTGQFLGSLPWASPEQAEGRQDDLDLRSDVYSLGVLLYCALAGRFPYDVDGNPRSVLTNIAEALPAAPSQHRPGLGGDLDTIVLKCLSKSPHRRYQTAGDLAADLRRCRDGEAIDARRDSATYMLRMQLRRHRIPVAIGLAFVGVIVVGLITSLTFWQQAADDRERARAEAAAADQSAARAEAVTAFLTEMLTAADPQAALANRDITVREVLDQAAREVADEPAADPDLEATIRTTLGRTYAAIGQLPAAEMQLRRAVELSADSDDIEARATRADALATVLQQRGALPEALELFEQSYRAMLDLRGPDDETTVMAANNYAIALLQAGQPDLAAPLLESVVDAIGGAIPADDPSAAQIRSNYGGLLVQLGDFDGAEQVWRAALEDRRALLDPQHPAIAESLNNLGMLLTEAGAFEEAETMLREALAINERILGPEHPDLGYALNNLANVVDAQQRPEEAEPLHRRALAIRIAALGDRHPLCTATRCNLALNLRAQGRHLEALALAEQALSGDYPTGPETGPRELLELFHAVTLADLGRVSEARAAVADLPERLAAHGRTEQAADAAALREQLETAADEP